MTEFFTELSLSDKGRRAFTDEEVWLRLDRELARAGATANIEHNLFREPVYESYKENGYGIGEPIAHEWRFQATGESGKS